MLPVRRFWPLLVEAAAMLLNTDGLIVLLRGFRAPQVLIVVVVPCLAISELLFTYWFWGWFLDCVSELREIRKIRQEMQKVGVWDWVLGKTLQAHNALEDPNCKIAQQFNRWGTLAIIFTSTWPIPGPRGLWTVFCGLLRCRRCLIALVIGDVIHVTSVVMGVNLFFGLIGR